MQHDDDVISGREPIPPNNEHEPPPEQAKPQEEPNVMSTERAQEVADRVGQDVYEDVGEGYSDEALEAAAVLKRDDKSRYAQLKADIKASEIDTNEWKSAVSDKARELTSTKRRRGDPRPVIHDRADVHEMIEESCDAMSELGGLYERGGEVVEIRDGHEGPEPEPIQKGRLREVLSRAARFEKRGQDGMRPIKPPRPIIDSVHARGQWGLPELEGVVDGACMLEDGTILSTRGYHPDAGVYLRNAVDVSGLQSPTQRDAIGARERLVDLLVDFPLEENRGAHESAWVALLLTIIARPAIGDAPTPMFLFDANRPRTGKTRMAELASYITTGEAPHPQPAPGGRNGDTEMRKVITGIARSGSPIVFFDNVKGSLGGPSLELAITARRWSARILGESRQWEGPLNVTWIATSNNASLTPDMTGRTLLCRLNTDLKHPEQRSNFEYPDIVTHVQEHRTEYLQDALTILRAWHVDGQPTHGLTSWGSFERWSHTVRNAIVYAGGDDPYDTHRQLSDADEETSALRAVLKAWPQSGAFTATQLGEGIDQGYVQDGKARYQELAEALSEFLPKSSPRSIGRRLSIYEGRVEGERGRKLVREREPGSGRRLWRVKEVGE